MKEESDHALVRQEGSPAAQTFQSLTNINWEGIDAEKAKVLADLNERLIRRQAEEAFNRAFAEMAPSLPVIERDGSIITKKGTLRSRYSTFEAIMEAVAEPLRIHGFAINFNTVDTGEMSTAKVTCKLRHKEGHSEPYEVRLPVERTDFRSAMQDVAATISFGKRWLVKLALNIVEKGDGDDAPKQLAFVTEEQVRDLETMIRDTNSDLARFLAYFGIPRLQDLSVKDHREALSMLQTKIHRQQANPEAPNESV